MSGEHGDWILVACRPQKIARLAPSHSSTHVPQNQRTLFCTLIPSCRLYLTRVAVKNFRCFTRLDLDKLDRLVVLVGENDAGKSVLLEAISVLIGTTPFGDGHLRETHDGQVAEVVEVEGTFCLEPHDAVPPAFRVGSDKSELRIRRRHTRETTELFATAWGFEDAEFDNFTGADRQKDLLKKVGLKPAAQEAERRAQLQALVDEGILKRNVERDIRLANFSELAPHMPRIERIASNEYKSPDAMIQRTLQSVASSVLKPVDEVSGQPVEAPELAKIREAITARLNEEIGKARDVLARVHPNIRELSVEPTIDFARAVSTSALSVDIGTGERLLSAFGEGTKKRMWMGLLEWEQQVARANAGGSVLRLYDEPDVNLHYHAQRHLFSSISNIACDESLHTQCIVCTHAVTLIDRAPCESVVLIQVDQSGERQVLRIGSESAREVMSFFNEVGRAVGLTNSVLLYERAFLLVEGESEAEGIPIIYRTLFNRTLHEDGIILVNLHTCSAWLSVMEIMLNNRAAITHLLLDADCREENSSANITVAALKKLGHEQEFLEEHVTFIGDKEYEDAFDDTVIAQALDAEFAREDGASWLERVAELKAAALGESKFSEDLRNALRKECVPALRSGASKPKLAATIARRCKSTADVPQAIREAFDAVRLHAGVVSPTSDGNAAELSKV